MKLPNPENAVIQPDKLRDYLLNLGHRRGGSKARLLHNMGYRADEWDKLEADIRLQHLGADVSKTMQSAYGVRYEILAPLTGPTGTTIIFRSIWQIDTGTSHPRLLTMYPR